MSLRTRAPSALLRLLGRQAHAQQQQAQAAVFLTARRAFADDSSNLKKTVLYDFHTQLGGGSPPSSVVVGPRHSRAPWSASDCLKRKNHNGIDESATASP
jgi:hypothetical protein